ncbi:MAG: 30S ribosomal protein S5 [Burkholderiales bacterium]
MANELTNSNEATELVDTLVSINRVAKVVKGGRRFNFSAIVVVGDKKGRVGWGLGKAKEVAEAKQKAVQAAKKAMIRVYLRESRTIHHDVIGVFGAGKVILRSARAGTGVIAGGPMRAVFEALGINDIVAKSLGSTNPHNMIKATFAALQKVTPPKVIAEKRSKKIGEIIERRESLEV